MKTRILLLLALVLMITVPFSCIGTPSATGPRITSIYAELLPPGTITASADDQPGMDVMIEISVDNFDIGEAGSAPENGYFIYYLDTVPTGFEDKIPGYDPPFPMATPGTAPDGEDSEESIASEQTSHIWTGLGPGAHVFAVQLVDRSGSPLDPSVIAVMVLPVPEADDR